MFQESSEFDEKASDGCFMVMIYEKMVKKRTLVPLRLNFRTIDGLTNAQNYILKCFNRLRVIKEKRHIKSRHAFEFIKERESKLLRFRNFWVELFNVKSLKPFTQLIKPQEYKEHRLRVTSKLRELIQGESEVQ